MTEIETSISGQVAEVKRASEEQLASNRKLNEDQIAANKKLSEEPVSYTHLKVLVLITRNYGVSDPVLNMGIPGEMLKRGCRVLTLSHLKGHDVDLSGHYPNLYWPFAQHILSGAKIIKEHPNLYAVYLTNHGCGCLLYTSRYDYGTCEKYPG